MRRRERAEAERRIDAAKAERADEIVFDDLGLVDGDLIALVPALAGLAELKNLSLDHNALTTLPPEISALAALESLSIDGNKLTTLPPEIGNLTALERLSFHGNQLTTLPPEIGNLTALDYLSLDDNELNKLPPEIGALTALLYLWIMGNRLTTLPSEIGALAALELLALTDNHLTKLPPEIGTLTALRTLALNGNQLSTLPLEIGALKELKTLGIRKNKLMALPAEIGGLTALRDFNVDDNTLTLLPPEIGRLAALKELEIENNRLTKLPPEIGALRALEKLKLNHNQLTMLPPEIGRLAAMNTLYLSDNQLTELPSEIGNLGSLIEVWINDNKLAAVPPDVQNLKMMDVLRLSNNKLTTLPPEIGALTALKDLSLDGNQLPQAYMDALDQGVPEFLAYMRSLQPGETVPNMEAKLLLTGEGDVGKTWLIRALRGERQLNVAETKKQSTFGVELGRLDITATLAPLGDVTLRFNSWDFGGQKVYRILHQFFFSGDALYLLVWMPRMGETQCDLAGWLRRIHLVAGDTARVVLVATHCDDPDQRYDPRGILRDVPEKLRNLIKAEIEVDSQSGSGIDDLKEIIGKIAAGDPDETTRLPRLGSEMNRNWQDIIEELVASEDRPQTMAWEEFSTLCQDKQLDEAQTYTLARVFLHENGRALFFGDRRMKGMDGYQLRDLLVLDPEWLSKAVTRVLEDTPTISCGGLLDHDRLEEIWADRPGEPRYPIHRYAFLVGLMEQLDFSYGIRSKQGQLSLIAQLLPDTRPELPWSLTENGVPADLQELRMVCDVGDEVPGLLPWLIAETHVYQVDDPADDSGRTRTWVDGVFLRSSDVTGRYEALIQLTRRPQHRLHLVVRGRRPHMFFDELLRIILATLGRWEGLEPRFFIPCPSHGGPEGRCEGRFALQSLVALPERTAEAYCDGPEPHFYSIASLLTGLDSLAPRRAEAAIIADEIAEKLRPEVRKMQESAWNALNMLLVGQQSRDAPCPRMFTLVEVDVGEHLPEGSRPKSMARRRWLRSDQSKLVGTAVGHSFHLQLYCEQSLQPVGAPYLFHKSPQWLATITPLLRIVLPTLDAIGDSLGDNEALMDQLRNAQEFMQTMAELGGPEHGQEIGSPRHNKPILASDADYRVLDALLSELDSSRHFRGMTKRLSPRNLVLWMSPEEAEFHKPIEARGPWDRLSET